MLPLLALLKLGILSHYVGYGYSGLLNLSTEDLFFTSCDYYQKMLAEGR